MPIYPAQSNLSYTRDPEFRCTYGRASREPGDFRAECVRTAELIGQSEKPIAILLSGGMDSEVVLRAFIEAQVPFKCFTHKIDYYTRHELAVLEQTCKTLGVRTEIVNIDVGWLTSVQAKSFMASTAAGAVEMLPHMKLMQHVSELGYMPVLGSGEVVLEQHGREWKYVEYEYDLAWGRFAEQHGFEAVTAFFQRTAELQLAALNNETLRDVLSGKNKLAKILSSTHVLKSAMYRAHWPDMQPRPKFDGFEYLRMKPFASRIQVPHLAVKCLIPVQEFRSMLEPLPGLDRTASSSS